LYWFLLHIILLWTTGLGQPANTFAPVFAATDTAIVFKGINTKIAYVPNRQLSDASFSIRNNTRQKVKITFEQAWLLRGNTQEILRNTGFKTYNGSVADVLIINPKTEQKIKIGFKPFVIYEGSVYTIKAEISVDGKEYDARSSFETFRQSYGDKNKYKK
jgi:hypothetical protein